MCSFSRVFNCSGVLGINRRNGVYIAEHNARKYYPRADNKILTKTLAKRAGIRVPELYSVISASGELRHLSERVADYDDFVVKPAKGSGGNGVIVVVGREGDSFLRAKGEKVSLADLSHHINNIISGLFSLGGHPDQAMIEYRVKFDPVFEHITVKGVPDIRLIIYKGVPVMAMLRLPTEQSRGRANLHQGAIGVGVRVQSGKTLCGVMGTHRISEHPDTGKPIEGLQIPGWDNLLKLAANCWEFSKLGYLGVDIVLDRELGPLMLEINARPGLAIQIANASGVERRLLRVDSAVGDLKTIEDRIAFAKEAF